MSFTRIHYPTFLPLLCLACLFIAGCEHVVDDPGALPYEEKLVIRGIVRTGEELDSILVTRTLPPLEEYSIEKAWVHGALVIIRHGATVDTLQDKGRGLYHKSGIIPQADEVFELTVEWSNKRASATTRAPRQPAIVSTHLRQERDRWGEIVDILEARVEPRPGEVYSATYMYTFPELTYSYEYPYVNNIYLPTDTLESGLVAVEAEAYVYNNEITEYKISVQAYDEAFYPYFTSYHGDNDELFEQDRRNVTWNVRGDGIGMFIGIAKTPYSKVE